MTYESKDQKGKVHPTEQEKSATPVSVEQQKTETVSPETQTPQAENESTRHLSELRGGDQIGLKNLKSEITEREHPHKYTPITSGLETSETEEESTTTIN